nr:hypothetical protein [uncultured Methanoregula sp.]
MDSLNLDSDESIQKKVSKIIINGTRCEAVLTSRRVILVERETDRVYRDIPYTDIALVVASVNAIHEPVLTITINQPDGGQQIIEIVFVYQPGGQNIQDLEKCIALFNEHEVPLQNNGILSAKTPKSRMAAVSPSLQVEEEPGSRNPASDRTVAGRPWQLRQLPPEDNPERSSFGTFVLILVALAVIIGGAFMAGQVLNAGKTQAEHGITPKPTGVTAELTTPVPTTTAPVTVIPTTIASPVPTPADNGKITSLPKQGIWAKISYPAHYSGSLGGDGRRIGVNGSGTQYLALPFQNTTIDGSVEKGDGSADLLEVEIYNGGSLVSKSETKRPFGIAEIHTPVGLPMGYSELPTPTPAAAVVVPTPDPSLTLHSVPSNGVWVRVAYPGTFSGSIGANGDWRQITGSGDQFYQLSMTDGVIESSIDKSDSLTKNMIVEIYKDGKQVLVRNTTLPRGNVKIYTTV